MDDEDVQTTFLDTILLALAGFVCIAILLLPHINPKVVKEGDGVTTQEGVTLEITWDEGLDADVDLWVQAPGDRPIGYSNKGGLVCNLLRDDLGHLADPLKINHEETVCRGIVPDQLYVVNVHAFRGANVWPVEVRMQATTKTNKGYSIQAFTTVGRLDRVGEEITLIAFKLSENGILDPDSVNTIYRPLREFKGK